MVCGRREQEVDMRIDAKEERIVLGTSGLQPSLPKILRGGLAYSPETQTVTGTFDKVRHSPPETGH